VTTHWFFSLGVNPQPAVYYRRDAATPFAERRFVTTALLEIGWPLPPERHADLVLHLIPTPELDRPGRGQSCRLCKGELHPPSPSPVELFLAELNVIAPGLDARVRRHETLPHRDDRAIWSVVRAVLDEVSDGDEVVLETTNGIRSIVNGFVLASGLLAAYRQKVRVIGATYAEFAAEELPSGVTSATIRRGSPVIDLLPFIQLFDWSHAVRAMSQYLDPAPTLQLLQRDEFRSHAGPFVQPLGTLGTALALNFPLEVERAAAAWHGLGAIEVPNLAAGVALRQIGAELESIRAVLEVPVDDDRAVLDEHRLAFDLSLAERLINARRDADAVRALREWIVNAVLFAWGHREGWLKQSLRARAERALNGIPRNRSAEVRAINDLWVEARDLRNAVSHLQYNEKHAIDVAALREFLSTVVGRLRALRTTSPDSFALAIEREAPRRLLGNAFGLGMLADASVHLVCKALRPTEARREAVDRESIVGHADTAALFTSLLGRPVAENRASVTLDRGDTILVGQYKGPRLPEGTTALPEGAKIEWILVELS
jgi:hypothetical protein